MNSDQLRYLIAISKEKTMSDAAEKLFVTPQALSMAIKKLEEELRMPLLSRSSTGTSLTENGLWLVGRAEDFFSDIENRQVEYRSYLNSGDIIPSGELELIMNNIGIGSTRLADMTCRLNQKYTNFRINLTEGTKQAIEEAVLLETLELGFVYRTKVNGKFIDKLNEDLIFYPLQTDELVIQAAPQLQLTRAKSIFLKKVAGYDFCMYDVNAEGRVEELLKRITGEEINCVNTNSFSVYKAGLESGKYITVSLRGAGEERCVNYLPTLKTFLVRDDVVSYFGVLRKKNRQMSDNMAFVWNELLKEYGGIISG